MVSHRMATLDDLHLAMGRFLTESSHVENIMLSLYYVSDPNRSFDRLVGEFLDQTFGTKIRMFKDACNAYPFCDEHRAILVDAYSDLDALLPKRNFIVHGSTYRMGKSDKPAQPYRIGKRKGDREFMNEVMASDFTAPHVFTVDGIDKVTEEFLALRSKLAKVVVDVVGGSHQVIHGVVARRRDY
jgi:hypothetical protein